MMELTLNGAEILNREELHEAIANGLNLPDWYGRNLDALWDCLTDLSEPTSITITALEALTLNLGAYSIPFIRVLKDAASENPNFKFAIVTE